ncbi:nitrogenase component 1 [Clostridium sp. LP20]|uniref:nitrogenase component 1 n=1 Tax=Clostridium sp. LP20 TaxID=3418665 RepID=UPI003EE45BF0
MNIYKYFPVASDRMGIIWTLSSIEDLCIIEFGPAGTTHYAVESIGQLNGEDLATIYSTHMDESDITFGSYERLENSIKEVDINKKPKYIFVMASSVSSIIGADVKSICRELQAGINAKLIPITTGGLKDDYNVGVESALELIAKNMVKESDEKEDRFNIIGSNIDGYNFLSDAEEIKRMMKTFFNKDLNTTFTAYTSVEKLEEAGKASLNIVIRKEGLKAAEYMKEKFNIPYVYKKPIGLTQSIAWIEEIKALMKYEVNEEALNEEIALIKKYLFRMRFKLRALDNKDVGIFADYDTVISMKSFIEELGLNVDRAEVLHGCKKDRDDILINLGEPSRLKYLKKELLILMGDGATLDMAHSSKLDLQISNPNIKAKNIYPYTPYIGFRGSLLLLEKILSV